MNPPNKSQNIEESIMPEWREPFPEPQPFPNGWDLREVLGMSQTVTGDQSTIKPEE
jgi:hypothetical protein